MKESSHHNGLGQVMSIKKADSRGLSEFVYLVTALTARVVLIHHVGLLSIKTAVPSAQLTDNQSRHGGHCRPDQMQGRMKRWYRPQW